MIPDNIHSGTFRLLYWPAFGSGVFFNNLYSDTVNFRSNLIEYWNTSVIHLCNSLLTNVSRPSQFCRCRWLYFNPVRHQKLSQGLQNCTIPFNRVCLPFSIDHGTFVARCNETLMSRAVWRLVKTSYFVPSVEDNSNGRLWITTYNPNEDTCFPTDVRIQFTLRASLNAYMINECMQQFILRGSYSASGCLYPGHDRKEILILHSTVRTLHYKYQYINHVTTWRCDKLLERFLLVNK